MVQDALCLSRNGVEAHTQQIERSTLAIAFLGTPHHGADLAAWATFGSKIANILNSANSDIVAVLKPGSEVLARIQKIFHGIVRSRLKGGRDLHMSCFYEELPVKVVGVVVPKDSAIIPGYDGYGIHANHMVRKSSLQYLLKFWLSIRI